MQKESTVFSQVLKVLPRYKFEAIVRKLGSDYWCKKFRSWDHFMVILFFQFSGRINRLRREW